MHSNYGNAASGPDNIFANFKAFGDANSFNGYYTESYKLTGDGRADIFVDGVLIHATWHHPDANVPAVYLDANGNPIDLDNGLTWVHVIGSQKWHSGI